MGKQQGSPGGQSAQSGQSSSPAGATPQGAGQAPNGDQGKAESKGTPTKTPSTGLPKKVQDAEQIAREIMDKIGRGKILPKDIERLGVSVDDIKAFLKEVERAKMAQPNGKPSDGSQPPPTFADFIEEINKTVKQAKKADPSQNASSSGEGKGNLRGVIDSLKETVDLEYQDVLEEYYRSLADPNWRRKK